MPKWLELQIQIKINVVFPLLPEIVFRLLRGTDSSSVRLSDEEKLNKIENNESQATMDYS